jgi:Domain of unknown function (DUF1883)
MNFNYWDLGQQSAGTIIQVTLSGNSPNVRLFDSANYHAFKSGRSARGYGGHATRSPVRLQVPSSGHWYVVVDYGGLSGHGRVGVQVLPGRLPELRERVVPSLDGLAQSVAAINHSDEGISRSAFGVVVLSSAFFAKNWTQYELDGLVTRSVDGSQVLLPLWHRLTKAEVMAYSPSLADKLARSTGDSTLEEIAAEIAEVVSAATRAPA